MAMAGTFTLQMYDSNTLLSSLVQLGQWFRDEAHLDEKVQRTALAQNGWFTEASVQRSLQSHGRALSERGIEIWTKPYDFPQTQTNVDVGLILAGNLPLVGWHDVMCAVLSGHKVHVKTSQDDAVLPRWVVAKWAEFDPYVGEAVVFHDGLMQNMDAVIATGGANASRYFQAYFGKLPHVIRGPRTSVAVLDGLETDVQLDELGEDIFAHFGMGCRSVTKVWLTKEFDLDRCFAQWVRWGHLAQHSKYANNYDYHKAVWLLNKEDVIENGFLLVKEDDKLVSPIGTLFIERYEDAPTLQSKLVARAGDIQVVTMRNENVCRAPLEAAGLRVASFGDNQCPALHDYADGIDTMSFLLTLPQMPGEA